MNFGVAILSIAIGALLRFDLATEFRYGVNNWTVGDILMVGGAVGAILSLILLMTGRRLDALIRRHGTTSAEPAARDAFDTRI